MSRLPSIFELKASDQLKDSLREAFRYLLNLIREHPRCRSLPPTDETVLVLDLFIEFAHLRAHRASYVENLYGLVRFSRSKNEKISQILPSLICLTLVPYLRRKLDDYFEKLNYQSTRTADEIKRIRIYRLLTRSMSLINLLYLLRYSTGKFQYHNLLNHVTGIGLSIKDPLEDESRPLIEYEWSKATADLLGRVLTVGSYIIQFIDYWNTHSNSMPLFSASLPIPKPPPKFSHINDDADNLTRQDLSMTWAVPYTDEKSSSICLICEHVRQNECALSNTGYVFCYSCIYKYVKTNHRCPVTGNPATVDNIVKLYQVNENYCT